MPDLRDGETVEMKGSGARPYILKNTGGVYSCSCPAWRNQSIAIESRTCKHLRKLRGDAAEEARVGTAPAPRPEPGADGGEAKAGPPLLLAESWDNAQDLAGWWMSEKLDGVRAYWDGIRLVSRLGNPFHAPDWFLEGFPETPLDGELWIGRKQFQRTVGIVRRQDRSDHWKEVSYVAFDAPAFGGPFEARIAAVRGHVVSRRPPHLRAHEHAVCEGIEHLRAELARVEALGGEGLMLRQPASAYEVGRSITLLKVKSFLDAEARVLEHLPGAGRHKGRLGALLVELADGTKFSVGTGFSDAERERPPAVGSLITFRYQELSDGGVPRFPSFLGVREDVAAPSTLVTTAAPPAAVAATVTAAVTAPSDRRRFELVEGGSAKFWEVARAGREVTVRYGRIGTDGQAKAKTLPDEAAALRHVEGLVREKTGKGYAEV
ncbi:DNA ligase [Aquisphaera giovannonii]|uniref:DNA ligase n=1 Tax=Aquisphaera giovannonii TaxID=406548 RepID=A0A5B9W321_9BACT|nr:DNA ligase [Aquisphaera giovannonii]QEH35023.1 DNA ligase [Aquisphaera giovannonii]